MDCFVRRALLVGAACWALLSPAQANCAESQTTPAVVSDDVTLVRSLAVAWGRLIDARRALETWQLQRLEALRQRGYATPRECAEQGLVVGRLEAHRIAAGEFADYVKQIEAQLAEPPAPEVHDGQTRATPAQAVALLTLPGSVRVVESLCVQGGNLSSTSSDASKKRVERLEQAQRRLDAINAATPSPRQAEEQRRAQLELAIATAELAFGQLAEQWQSAQVVRTVLTQFPVEPTPAAGPLLIATRRVAEAEAAASGELQMAQVAAQRTRLLVDSYQSLAARKLATDQELQDAQRKAVEAAALVTRLEGQRKQLQRALQRLPAAVIAVSRNGSQEDFSPQLISSRVWHDRATVQHLLGLRMQRCLTAAETTHAAARLRDQESLHEQLAARLSKSSAGQNMAGPTRELEFLKLDVEYCRAQLQAVRERCEALRLEEMRFALQGDAQPARVREVALVKMDANAPQMANPADYLQMPTVDYFASARTQTALHQAYYEAKTTTSATNLNAAAHYTHPPGPIALPRPYTFGLPPVPSDWSMVDTAMANSNTLLRYRKISHDGSGPDLHGRQSPYLFPSYADFYQFGIRRPDLSPVESRATPYGGPWYLPGAPTNFR